MNQVYLLIGGNEGNPSNNLRLAIENINADCGHIERVSWVYQTAAWGKTDQPDFLNQAVLLSTSLSPADLMAAILAIEEKMGRKRTQKYAPRIIDIDILFYNEQIINQKDLKIPHPEIQNRRFVLEPMNEIAPDWMHPVLHQTIHELWLACQDPLNVKKI
jgi:2-amino-4-hydroxy-6-hydroxymethyldihydropteridine diphosphokinase